MFVNALKDTLNDEFNNSRTENGALGYKTTGKSLLDLNFAISSLRKATDNEIMGRFMKAFHEDKMLAMRWLFYARDAREGCGERRLFRVVIKDLAQSNPEIITPLISLIAEYGRYDDLWCLLDVPTTSKSVLEFIDKQLTEDLKNMKAKKPCSLLSKWLPSPNASSQTTKRYAQQIRKGLGLTEREYRKALSKFRKYLDVVEVKMSSKNWSKINYEAVPSRANLIYNNAFLRNDEDRRREYLGKLSKGEAKINASVLFPQDIVHKYSGDNWYGSSLKPTDETIEALWKALPDTVQGCGNTLVVADGSGSMTCTVDNNSKVTALEVANALAIYFAEHSSGEFKDKYITFSQNPQLIDFSKCTSLHDKLQTALAHNEVANTNIEKVFDLILYTAMKNNMKQEDLPQNVLIISDDEFDMMCSQGYSKPNAKLFDVIQKRFKAAGYSIPRLVFWNVNSRTGTIPVKENDLGVSLVSGFSVNVCKMVLSGKIDPYECLLEALNSKRYDPIEEVLNGINKNS